MRAGVITMMDKQLSILMGKQVKSKPLKTYDFCNNINGNKMINLSRQLSWSLTHMELVTPPRKLLCDKAVSTRLKRPSESKRKNCSFMKNFFSRDNSKKPTNPYYNSLRIEIQYYPPFHCNWNEKEQKKDLHPWLDAVFLVIEQMLSYFGMHAWV